MGRATTGLSLEGWNLKDASVMKNVLSLAVYYMFKL